jgi:hypothetical protein
MNSRRQAADPEFAASQLTGDKEMTPQASGFEHRHHTTVQIDHLPLSDRDRLLAEAYLRKAEGMAEVIHLAARKLRSAAAFVGGSLTR